MTKPDTEAIGARCEAATEGPWEWVGYDLDCPHGTVICVEDEPEHAHPELQTGVLQIAEWNRPFIAHARQDIPDLLDYINELKEGSILKSANNDVSRLSEYADGLENEIKRLREALEEIADLSRYLSLELHLGKSEMTKQEWARAVLNDTLAWKKGKMVALAPKEPAEKGD